MIETGTATSGISVVRQFPRNKNTTMATRMMAITSVRTTSVMVAVTKTVELKKTVYARSAGKRVAASVMVSRTLRATSTALEPGD